MFFIIAKKNCLEEMLLEGSSDWVEASCRDEKGNVIGCPIRNKNKCSDTGESSHYFGIIYNCKSIFFPYMSLRDKFLKE